jgi:hypothetical protein
MLLTPTLALLTIVFNFCALLHVTDPNGLSTSGWSAFNRAIHALGETTVTADSSYLGVVAHPPPTSSPVYPPTLRRAEWAYRSSAVRILDLVDGSSKAQVASVVASVPLLPPSLPSPTKPTNPIASASTLPPTLTSPVYPATFKQFPKSDASTLSAITSPVAQSLGVTVCFFCLACALVCAWLKVSRPRRSRSPLPLSVSQNRRFRQLVHAPRPILARNAVYQTSVDDFHSVHTATPIPSYAGSEVDSTESESEGSSSRSQDSRVDFPTTPRTFPIIITDPDGKALFNAEIKLSSNNVVTSLSTTTSTVSFSIDVVASLDVPTGVPLRPYFTSRNLTSPSSA